MSKIFRFLLCLVVLLNFHGLRGQNGFENIHYQAGHFSFKPLLHASLVFKINEQFIYVDPSGTPALFEGLKKPNLVMITDIHQDHYDPQTLENIVGEETQFLVPQAVYDRMPEKWQKHSTVLANGEDAQVLGIAFKGVPMYNLAEEKQKFHVKGRGNGYLIQLTGFNIYLSGDTEGIPEMRELKNIDLAFVCMNEPYTMSVEQAADAVLAFKPKLVYPYHYRNGDKSLSDVAQFASLIKGSGVEVVQLNWYPN